MVRPNKLYFGITLLACLVFLNTFTGDAQGFSCASGASDPPFLASGVDPNLLLLIVPSPPD